MMGGEDKSNKKEKQQPISSKCFFFVSLKKKPSISEENHDRDCKKQPGGWKAMPYILGNETCERLASFGLVANFMVFLRTVFHMDQVYATNVINVWAGITNFAPLFGAFLSDSYLGRFKTIAFASMASFIGMTIMTLTVWLPWLHPPPCTPHQPPMDQCQGPTARQFGILVMALGFLSIGSGGIRPCSIPFGVDQFDPNTDGGRRGINSFFNWYYMSFTIILVITQTVVVYVQDTVSWVLGFGIPTLLMLCSIMLFFAGRRVYVNVKPEGSVFSGISQVAVAAYKKRHLELMNENGADRCSFYDPPLKGSVVLSKLPLTNQFRYLNKAALISDNDLHADGTTINNWNLCTIQQVEEFKCLVRIIPIWASGILSLTSMTQQSTFTISQALQMDRHLGPKFEIPAGSITVISLITIALWLPVYDRFLVPSLRRITKQDHGISVLQRIGIGILFSILSMIVAGLVERERRTSALLHHEGPLEIAPMSVLWLAPQLILMGFCEAFNIIGQIEFFNRQFPDHMTSIGNSLFSCSFAGASYVSSLLVVIVHNTSGGNGGRNWLGNDLNVGRLDYFYFLIAGLGFVNLVYFFYCAKRYRYKGSEDEGKLGYVDVELSSVKA